MLYRYRLSKDLHNKDVDSRGINGITLWKNRWFVSNSKLEWGAYSTLVEEESANSKEDFLEKEQEKVRAHRLKVSDSFQKPRVVKKNNFIRKDILPEKEEPTPFPVEQIFLNSDKEPEVIVEEPTEPDISEDIPFIVYTKSKINRMNKKALKSILVDRKVPEIEFKKLKLTSLKKLVILTQEVQDV